MKNSLVLDPAQEVRETCELALQRIEELKSGGSDDKASMAEKSPFLSVDPAAPASSYSSIDKLRYFSLLVMDATFYLSCLFFRLFTGVI